MATKKMKLSLATNPGSRVTLSSEKKKKSESSESSNLLSGLMKKGKEGGGDGGSGGGDTEGLLKALGAFSKGGKMKKYKKAKR